mgnify:CR=1 FL=1|tara:strand:+ start:294 stop:461 length:168 start_codon:yes stop_codon:yes gene_type:complete
MIDEQDLLPCAFCGSENIRTLDILIASDDGEEEVEAVECLECDAQARLERWNNRI